MINEIGNAAADLDAVVLLQQAGQVVEHANGLLAAERFQAQHLKDIGETGQQTTAGVQLGGRHLAEHAQLPALQVRQEERGDAVRRTFAALADKVEQVVNAEDA